MNTQNIKTYAPKARTDFIAAVTKQAARYGITEIGIQPIEIKGDIALIGGRPFPVAITKPRAGLVQLIEQKGFNVVMEQVAYSWFNRLCAIRYMELHGYLDHGRRVLSHPEHAGSYQILDDCLEIDLPGLDQARVRALKEEGTKDEELYRKLLLAQCHALHEAMPFLFEPVDDATELLLPENLTKTDSLIKELVNAIPEEAWANIEIIGWLYQFYISEKKDEVIGKVVKSEDIPAATQLFTPNWIVKYMVQNSLGAQWLATYPQSPLKAQMEYYIEPAEQTDEVNAQLAAITPSQLNPEELTLIDPACGSGHILVEAYELFKAIYLERGYRQRDIPQLILEKNLFGLDIDERAAQLSGFALMMKGRADDRRLFEPNRKKAVKLNVMALVDSAGFDAEGLTQNEQVRVALSDYGLKPGDLTELKRLFEHATTFGSLIQVPKGLAEKLPGLKQLSEMNSQDLFVSGALKRLGPLVQQAELLAAQYDAVVANPPYMGSKGMNALVKSFTKEHFPGAKSDLFACFMERALALASENARYSLITMPSWLFLSSFEKLREKLFAESTISSLLHMGRGIFGIDFGSTAFVVQKTKNRMAAARYFRLHKRNFQHIHLLDIAQLLGRSMQVAKFRYDFDSYRDSAPGTRIPKESMSSGELIQFVASQSEFSKIPGSPMAYWLSERVREAFEIFPSLETVAKSSNGVQTGNNDRFLRLWPEVNSQLLRKKWIPYNKGGEFRKWYGNIEYLVLWDSNGKQIKAQKNSCLRGEEHYGVEGVTWSDVTSRRLGARYLPKGCIFDAAGPSAFTRDSGMLNAILCLLNTTAVNDWSKFLNPTIHFQTGDFRKLVLSPSLVCEATDLKVTSLITQAVTDWNAYERSWDFQSLPLLTASSESTPTLESSYTAWITQNRDTIAEMKRLEEENNRLFIDAYGLADELTPDVPIEQITLTVNSAYRYGGKLTEEEQLTRFRQDTMEELVSYAIGCMMGRYSLDAPGLIYAHSGNEGFDPGKYTTFPADDDGIVPLTSMEWFDDDAANRLEEFIGVAWDDFYLEQNLAFLADNLSPKRGEGSRDTIRRYLSDKFFKDHLQTYKKRPIYWLFSSGKEKAFQCLVYLHRYNDGTLARMRTEYVIPLTSKLTAYVDKLEKDKEASGSTAEIKKLEKQIIQLHKQQAELSHFDEKLRHFADQRIKLDLDDGVKVNYGKFGDLLAEVKAITGKSPK